MGYKASENGQEIPQSKTTDQPTTGREKIEIYSTTATKQQEPESNKGISSFFPSKMTAKPDRTPSTAALSNDPTR